MKTFEEPIVKSYDNGYKEGYAKGRADLLKEIGEPVAWRYDFSGDWWLTDNKEKVDGIKKQARVVQPLYILPKEKSWAKK